MEKTITDKHEINSLCAKCMNQCKQTAAVMLLQCPKFKQAPKQLEFKF